MRLLDKCLDKAADSTNNGEHNSDVIHVVTKRQHRNQHGPENFATPPTFRTKVTPMVLRQYHNISLFPI